MNFERVPFVFLFFKLVFSIIEEVDHHTHSFFQSVETIHLEHFKSIVYCCPLKKKEKKLVKASCMYFELLRIADDYDSSVVD